MAITFKAAFVAAALPYLVAADYSLKDSYEGTSLYDGFNFLTDADVSGGWVTYVSQDDANSKGLLSTGDNNSARIGVDHTTVISDTGAAGRSAVRLSSKNAYKEALWIFDASHMPGGTCGMWPAYWLLGNAASGPWPTTGEWDILENVNNAQINQMTAHTASGCSTNNNGGTGTLQSSNCNQDNAGTGCGIIDESQTSWGNPLNDAQGGVWATEKTDSFIKTWFFARDSIPSDITNKAPNPSSWGQPIAIISNDDGCNVGQFYPDPLNVIINTDFCGGWAQGTWGTYCAANTGTDDCKTYVGNNPDAFKNAYWDINYLRVYQSDSASANGAPAQNVTVPYVYNKSVGGPGYKGVAGSPFF